MIWLTLNDILGIYQLVNHLVSKQFIHSVLRPLLWVAKTSHVHLSLSDRIVLSQSCLLDRRPVFVLVSLILVCFQSSLYCCQQSITMS